MSKRLDDIQRRKQALIEKAARERIEVAAALRDLRSPFDLGGVVARIGRALEAHPLIAAGASTLLVSGLGRSLVKPVREFLSLWRLVLPIWRWWKSRRGATS